MEQRRDSYNDAGSPGDGSCTAAMEDGPGGSHGGGPAEGTVLRKYLYEIWHLHGSRSRFCCRGRCVSGPKIDFGYNACAWVWIVGPTLFYFVVCAPDLIKAQDAAAYVKF